MGKENQRLLEEVARLEALLRLQREKATALETDVQEGLQREEQLKDDVEKAKQCEANQRARGDELQLQLNRLEELLAAREAEVDRLRQALEDQRLLADRACEVCEAREHAGPDPALAEALAELEAKVRRLEAQLADSQHARAEMEVAMGAAAMATEKMMQLHQAQMQRVETLRAAKLTDAIKQKVELHIAVPKVTLTYNNAPPLLVSAAVGLSESKIRDFLDKQVFPQFEPLWCSLDSSELAPDGTHKKMYATRMLELLTNAVKLFIEKSQKDEDAPGISGESQGGESQGGNGGASTAPAAKAPVATATSESDKEKLLKLLRSGDDRALDASLVQLLQKRGAG